MLVVLLPALAGCGAKDMAQVEPPSVTVKPTPTPTETETPTAISSDRIESPDGDGDLLKPCVDVSALDAAAAADLDPIFSKQGIRTDCAQEPPAARTNDRLARKQLITRLAQLPTDTPPDLAELKKWTDASMVVGAMPERIIGRHIHVAELARGPYGQWLHLWAGYFGRARRFVAQSTPVSDLFIVTPTEKASGDRLPAALELLIEHRLVWVWLNPGDMERLKMADGRAAFGELSVPTILAFDSGVFAVSVNNKLAELEKAGINVYRISGPDVAESAGDSPKNLGGIDDLRAALEQPAPGLEPAIVFEEQDLALQNLGITTAKVRDFKIESGAFPLRQHHRAMGGKHLFWLWNPTDQPQSPRVLLRGLKGAVHARRETGPDQPMAARLDDAGIHLQLSFEPYEAYGLIIDTDAEPEPPTAQPMIQQWTIATLDGPWTLRIDPAAQIAGFDTATAPAELTQPAGTTRELAPWSELGLAGFAGCVEYSQTIRLDKPGREGVWLDLGRVGGVAEVMVNDQATGARGWSPWTVDITPFVQPGQNRILVRVYAAGKAMAGLLGPVRVVGRNQDR